jgi:hypothetical protein
VSVISTANPVLSQLGITLTATVTSPAGTPVGSANFLDGTALLGNVTLLNGQATLSTSSLKVGVHQISVSYSGDSNFAPASSAVLSQAVLDFSVDLGSGSGDAGSASESTQTASSGAIATYSLQIVPTNGTILPAPVTLAVTGLPSGATANITPSSWSQGSNGVWTYPANTPVGSFTLSVNTPNASARLDDKSGSSSKAPLLFWSVLLLPLAASIRRARKLFLQLVASVLLICAGPVMSVGLGGCGSGSGTSIVQNAQQQTYTLTVTATSGPLSHALTLTLIVQ